MNFINNINRLCLTLICLCFAFSNLIFGETIIIKPINKNILIVADSDPRGTMYGIYELSERLLGTDPLKFWTGHIPDKKEMLIWRDGTVKNLPYLPIDPIYKQDETIVYLPYKTRTFKEIIEQI